jgi:NAD(P)-dependent dehydrogenase (short-subunit alcohol dehydrogenase family)
MSKVLDNKVALITGACGGIGEALVRSFAEAGAHVVASDIVEPSRPFGSDVTFIKSNVCEEGDVQSLIDEVASSCGGLDILVNNAAVLTPTAPLESTSLDEFDKLVAVNLRGAFLLAKYSLPHLRQTQGCVLNVSSMAGVHGEKHHAIYAATKGAINALTQSMAVDWGGYGIRVNAICPSSVLTPNVDKLIKALPNAAEIVQLRKQINALGVTATPEQIASVAVFLCCEQAAFVSGAIVPVSGGSHCGYGLKY